MKPLSEVSIDYIRHILDATGWTANELSKRAGIAPTTLNRPLNKPDFKSIPNVRTIDKISAASGLDFITFALRDRQLRPLMSKENIESV